MKIFNFASIGFFSLFFPLFFVVALNVISEGLRNPRSVSTATDGLAAAVASGTSGTFTHH